MPTVKAHEHPNWTHEATHTPTSEKAEDVPANLSTFSSIDDLSSHRAKKNKPQLASDHLVPLFQAPSHRPLSTHLDLDRSLRRVHRDVERVHRLREREPVGHQRLEVDQTGRNESDRFGVLVG